MTKVKTSANDGDVIEFLNSVDDSLRKSDSFILLELFIEITGIQPRMWGRTIVGFGSYHFKYDSGREGDWFLAGFSPRKQSMSIYIMPGFAKYGQLLARLGKHKTGKSCLYVNKLSDVDVEVLKELIRESFNFMNVKYNA